MKKYIPFLIIASLLFSGCLFNSKKELSNTSIKDERSIYERQLQEISNEGDKGSGEKQSIPEETIQGSILQLVQTEEKTSLYDGIKLINIWDHTPPEKNPFIWDEACSIVWQEYEKHSDDINKIKEKVWNNLSIIDKQKCMKESFSQTIKTKEINERFIQINQFFYEWSLLWVYDRQNGNTQYLTSDGDVKSITTTNTNIVITTENARGDEPFTVFKFDKNFNKLKGE